LHFPLFKRIISLSVYLLENKQLRELEILKSLLYRRSFLKKMKTPSKFLLTLGKGFAMICSLTEACH
jgi:hypothetical protein